MSDETRRKVLQAAEELGYSLHSSARALRKGQSEEICIVVDLPPTSIAQRAVEMLVSGQTGQPLPEALSGPLMPQLIRRGST